MRPFVGCWVREWVCACVRACVRPSVHRALPCEHETDYAPFLPKSRHTLKMMVSGLFVEFEITVNHVYDIIMNTVTMRT